MTERRVHVDYMARVEGEGALTLTVEDDRITEARLEIFEPPRFFEALLHGRDWSEAPDITARICGICPVAYQMSAVHALERAADVRVAPGIAALRRLFYCGEWIESHALHIFLLHAPDFLGLDDAFALAQAHRDVVEAGLAIKKAGNDLVALLGGREIHPINVRLGGFHRVPTRAELQTRAEPLARALDAMDGVIDWLAVLAFPDAAFDYEFVALRNGTRYPMNSGRIVSTGGLDIDADAFERHIVERQKPPSTALYASLASGGTYCVGPMARFNLNRDCLTERARSAADRAGIAAGCRNPFQSILVRGVEIVLALEEALRLIEAYEPPEPTPPPTPRPAVGCAATEAPRGLLYHRYEVDDQGRIASARIVPPTAQNQQVIEADLRAVAERSLDLSDSALQWRCEQTIRNYDPCISCAAHFLTLTVQRRGTGPGQCARGHQTMTGANDDDKSARTGATDATKTGAGRAPICPMAGGVARGVTGTGTAPPAARAVATLGADTGRPQGGHRAAVIGIGNRYRGDDGVGPAAIDRLRREGIDAYTWILAASDPGRLIDAWQGASRVVLIDAAAPAGQPGHLHRLAPGNAAPQPGRPASSHGLDLSQAWALAHSLGQCPAHVVLFAIEGAHFGHGKGLSPSVRASLPSLVAAVRAVLADPAAID
ncbi:hypothetical protein CCR85_06415 [Rhodothalassium salexigens]|uniref:hydrogenase maturation protease n=1 Tax=Rhodothalassium salexigens TaxID=1086 RepID=UPI001911E2DB|nr:hydrogenase maturation protease [Rhodothalassium salexigens]MBK5911124.1 hypothetical protein [Rhodothalassium salexigens]